MNRWRTVSGARNGNLCDGYRKMSVKRTLNRGSNALNADAVSSHSATSISDAHKRPERGRRTLEDAEGASEVGGEASAARGGFLWFPR